MLPEKPEVIEKEFQAIWSRTVVRLPMPKEEADELRRALEIVDRHKKKALRVASKKEKNADWTMVRYAVKSDCVIVTIEQGACG